jgi:hypothetical protein
MTDRRGTAVQAIEFAIEIDDHFDRLQFLNDWLEGVAESDPEWSDYWHWLQLKALKEVPV